jgi:hypothetical protein
MARNDDFRPRPAAPCKGKHCGAHAPAEDTRNALTIAREDAPAVIIRRMLARADA